MNVLGRRDKVAMRALVLLCLVGGNLACFSFAEAAEREANLPPIQNLATLSDLDLGLAYLWAQQEKQRLHNSTESDRFSGQVRRFLLEAKSEIQKRGSTRTGAGFMANFGDAVPMSCHLDLDLLLGEFFDLVILAHTPNISSALVYS